MPDLILPESPYLKEHMCLNFEIHAKSFLWNQIRILIQTFISYAQQKITKDQILKLLE